MEGSTRREVPSAFQPGSKCGLQGLINELQNAEHGRVVSITFSEKKYKYNIQIPIVRGGEITGYFRLANIESELIHPPFDNGFHYNDKVALEARNSAMKNQNDLAKNEIPIGTKQAPKDDVFFDASWSSGKEKPLMGGICYSDDLLIDTDGKRKYFTVGWYDFDDKKWRCKSNESLDEEQLLWQYLPLSKYDKK